MGAANCTITNNTSQEVYVTQHNYSDYLLCFPALYKLATSNAVELKAAADARGLRFGVWLQSAKRIHYYKVCNGAKISIDGTEQKVYVWEPSTYEWCLLTPYRSRRCASKAAMSTNFCDCLRWLGDFAEKQQIAKALRDFANDKQVDKVLQYADDSSKRWAEISRKEANNTWNYWTRPTYGVLNSISP